MSKLRQDVELVEGEIESPAEGDFAPYVIFTRLTDNGPHIYAGWVEAVDDPLALQFPREAHGPARVLVNCAGIAPAKRIVGRNGPMPLADCGQVLRVNLIGSVNLLRLAAAELAAAGPLEDDERGVQSATSSLRPRAGPRGQGGHASCAGAARRR